MREQIVCRRHRVSVVFWFLTVADLLGLWLLTVADLLGLVFIFGAIGIMRALGTHPHELPRVKDQLSHAHCDVL